MPADRVEERVPLSDDLHAATSRALVTDADSDGGAQTMSIPSRALVAPLAQSIARAQISSAPTLLPPHLAQFVTALSFAARVSLRASALFIEAIVETLRRGTATGLGVTRRALIAAVGSARTLHYIKEGLDWSGKDAEGNKIEDAFLQILDKYTNLGIYLIHHTFTLAELFSMSGFYLTLNTIQTGFHAAEESVRLFDSILGSTESSRALSSIITLVRTEFSRDDPRFRPTSLLSEQEQGVEHQQRQPGALGSLAALTKAMTAFACLQMATHRRTLRELKQRVVYDCTVVIDSQADTTSDGSPHADEGVDGTPSRNALKTSRPSPILDPTPDFAGRYAAPSLPPRRRLPSGTLPTVEPDDLPSTASDDTRIIQSHRRTSSITSIAALTTDFDGQLLTDLRSDFESRIASSRTQTSLNSTAASSPTWSRRTSVAFDLAGLGFTTMHSKDARDGRSQGDARIPAGEDVADPGLPVQFGRTSTFLCDTPSSPQASDQLNLIRLAESDEARHVDERVPARLHGEAGIDVAHLRSEEEKLPPEVKTLLALLEQRHEYSGPAAHEMSSRQSNSVADDPVGRSGTHVVRTRSGRFSYEVRVEESVSMTTTTVCAFDGVDKSRVILRTARSRNVLPSDLNLAKARPPQGDASVNPDRHPDGNEAKVSLVGSDADWVEIATKKRRTASPESSSEATGASGSRRDERPTSGLKRGRQRLQVALSSVTKTLTHDRRWPGAGEETSRIDEPVDVYVTPGPAKKAGSSIRIRRKLANGSSRATPAGSPDAEGSVAASTTRESASPVLRAFANPFKSRHRDGAATRVSSTPGTPRSLSPQTTRSPFDRSDAVLASEEVGEARFGLGDLDAERREADSRHVRPTAQPLHAPSPRHSSSQQTLRSRLTTTCHEASLPSGVPEPGSSNFPRRHLVENLQHFARYSSAAYGQSFLRVFGIARHDFKFPHTEIHANNHAFAHHVGIHVEDILLSSFTDPSPTFASEDISQIVNYVSVDHSIKAIVLACRGSLGLADILTDLTCSYEPIPVPHADPRGSHYVHSGMFCASTSLQRGVVHDVIAEALARYPDYGLVLCGHSLGGGVASLLSILWSQPTPAFRRELDTLRGPDAYPPLQTLFVTSRASGLPAGRPISCYTYGVPCVASPDLVAYCRGLVISTVHNYDIVPTLSLGVLRDLKSMATGFYAEQGICEAIVGRVIGTYRKGGLTSASSTGPEARHAADDGVPTDPPKEAQLVLLSSDELTSGRGDNKAVAPAYQDPDLVGKDIISADVELSNWLWSLRTTLRAGSDNEKLYPPGNVYVVENYGVFIEEHDSSRAGPRREGRRVLLRAIDDVERRFSEPVFSRTMLSDHSPASYEINCDLLAAAVI